MTYSRYSKIAVIRGNSVGGYPDDLGYCQPHSLKCGEAVQSSDLVKNFQRQLFGQQESIVTLNLKHHYQLKSRLHS